MTYKIVRNSHLIDLPEEFTAKNWESASKKVKASIQENKELMRYVKEHKLSLDALVFDMLVEIGKDY